MTSSYVPVIHGAAPGRPDEEDTVLAAAEVAGCLAHLGYETEIVPLDLDFEPLRAIAARRPLVVFNLVEALQGSAIAAPLAPAFLDTLGLAYTGARTAAWCDTLSKLTMKMRLSDAGIPAPRVVDGNHPVRAGARAIVKSVTEHASVGMDAGSVVAAESAAGEILAREARFGGRFFAEAFVAGREFNVALLQGVDGPEVLPIQEICFDSLPKGVPHIVDYDAKWHPESVSYVNTPRRFGLEAQEPDIAERLRDIALECWRLFGFDGYARVDFRLGKDGTAYVLEVNANPCLASDAGFMAAAVAAGLTPETVIERIVSAAAGCLERAA